MSGGPLLMICFAFVMCIATYHKVEGQISLDMKATTSAQDRNIDKLIEMVTKHVSSDNMEAFEKDGTTTHIKFPFIANAYFKTDEEKSSTQIAPFSIIGHLNEMKPITHAAVRDVMNVDYEENLSTKTTPSDVTGLFYNTTTSSENTSIITTLDNENGEDDILQIHILVQYIQNTFLLPIFCPISIVGNSIVAYTMTKKIQTNTANRYLLTLLMTDIISLVSDLCLPVATTLGLYTSSQFEREAAAVVFYVNIVSIGIFFRRVNLNMFCVLSYERYIAIAKPFQCKTSVTYTKFNWFLIGSCVWACLTTIPTLAFFPLKPDLAEEFNYFYFEIHKINYEPGSFQRAIVIVIRLLDGSIHIIFFTVMNILSVKSLRQASTSTSLKESGIRMRNYSGKLLKVFLFLSVTNIISWLPQNISNVYMLTMSDVSEIAPLIYLITIDTHFLRALNSMIDYVVLILLSKEIRKNVKEILPCVCVCKVQQNVDIELRVANE